MVKKLIWQAYHKAYNFLKNYRQILEISAKELMEKETLSEDQLRQYFNELVPPPESAVEASFH
jgi:ATP-dependent Zn protease